MRTPPAFTAAASCHPPDARASPIPYTPFDGRLSPVPDYLRDPRRIIASILWFPFSWLVQALVFAVVGMIITALIGVRSSLEPGTALLIIALLPLVGMVAAATAAGVITLRHRGPAVSGVGVFLRGFAWFFSFPARGWMIGFGAAVKFMLVYAIAVVIGFIGLLIAAWAISTMIEMGANGWLILLVGIALPGITIGGAVWGNQYGGGTSGGMPAGCIIFGALAIVGGLFWFFLLVAVLSLFALPASIVLLSFHGGTFSSFDWHFHEWVIALTVFAAMVLPAFLVEYSGAQASSALLDKLPIIGERRRKKREAAARLAESQRRAAAERQRWQDQQQRIAADAEQRRIRWERESARSEQVRQWVSDELRRTLRGPSIPPESTPENSPTPDTSADDHPAQGR